MIPRSILLALSWGTLSVTPLRSTQLPQQLLPVYGGAGGTSFSRSCGVGKVLTGLRFRAGLLVDAVGLLCRPVSATGTLGSESTVGTLVGGSSGTSGTVSCGTGSVVVGAAIRHGSYVDMLKLNCRRWEANTRRFETVGYLTNAIGNSLSTAAYNEEKCEASSQPAIAIRGRSHSLVDAIGFICDEP